jgi:hypothetical protein
MTDLPAQAAQPLVAVVSVDLAGTPFTATLTDHKRNSIDFFGTGALARFVGTTIVTSP